MKKVITLQDLVKSPWGERFSSHFGGNLISAFLHGNCLYEGFDALHESFQVSFILKRATPGELSSANRMLREMKKDNLHVGYFFTDEFVRNRAEDYPLEFLHLSQKNVPLFGPAPLPGFFPDEAKLREECKRELENRRTHLIREFTRIQAGISPMDFFIGATSEIFPILYGIYFAQKKSYPRSRESLLESFPEFRLQEPALDFKQNVERADALFEAIDKWIQDLG